MRIKIIYECNKLPLSYRHRFMALIKEALLKADKNYKDKLYPEKTRNFKPFCFAVYLSRFELEKDFFVFKDRKEIELIISSPDFEFISILYNGLRKIDIFNICEGVDIKKIKILYLKQYETNKNIIIFRTLSPVLVEDEQKKFLLPENNLYKQNLEFLIKDRISTYLKKNIKDININILEIKTKKRVIKHFLKGAFEQINKELFLTCSEGLFQIQAQPEILNLINDLGIGKRCGQGFGMVEVIK